MNYEMQGSYAAADEGNPQNEYRWAMIAAGIGAVIVAIGMFIFASNADNREDFHGWYLLAFFAFTAGFSVAFGMKRFGLAIFSLIVLVAILGVSIMKFQYRASLASLAVQPGYDSIIGDYLRTPPPLEVTYMPFSDDPKWVQFDKDCYRPLVAKQGDVPEMCKTKETIVNTYNINIIATIKQRYALMRATAQQIEQKQLVDKASYESCVTSGGCAEVPMLPADANIVNITASSPDYKDIRLAFWDLIKNEEMDAASCAFIPLCKTMFDAGAVTRTDFETLKAS